MNVVVITIEPSRPTMIAETACGRYHREDTFAPNAARAPLPRRPGAVSPSTPNGRLPQSELRTENSEKSDEPLPFPLPCANFEVGCLPYVFRMISKSWRRPPRFELGIEVLQTF